MRARTAETDGRVAFSARFGQQVSLPRLEYLLQSRFCNDLGATNDESLRGLAIANRAAGKTATTLDLERCMDSNTTNQQYFNGVMPLAEPHFDEEATLLSARPVVPLQDVKAEARSRNRLVIGLAMACSVVVGAFGATLIYKQRGQQPPTAIVGTAVPGAAGIPLDESAPALGEDAVGAVNATSQTGAATVDKKTAPWVSRSPATVVAVKRMKASPREVDEIELSRTERIDARRLRRRSEREAWREAGGRPRRPADDTLRIRDIFEGPSRP